MVVIKSDLMTKPLVDLWNVLLDLSERVPQAWSLIGGQMVLMHGLEHGRTPPAASADLAFLLSLPMNPIELRDQLEKSDRKKLALAAALHNPQHPGWRELRDAAARADGQSAYAFLSPP